MKPMIREEVRAWKARWEMVNRFEIEELRRTPVAKKYAQFIACMRMAIGFDWPAQDAEVVRQRWRRIREHYLGQETTDVARKTKRRSA